MSDSGHMALDWDLPWLAGREASRGNSRQRLKGSESGSKLRRLLLVWYGYIRYGTGRFRYGMVPIDNAEVHSISDEYFVLSTIQG